MHSIPEKDEEYTLRETTEIPEERECWRKGFRKGLCAGGVLAFLCAGVFLAGWYITGKSLQRREYDTVSGAWVLTDSVTQNKLKQVKTIIEQNYLGEVDSKILSSYMFKGIAAGLEDPYANYYSAEELQTINDQNQGGYFGLGATLSQDQETGKLLVLAVYEESPASECGLQEGDELQSLDGEILEGKDLTEVVTMIKGKTESFTMGIYRSSSREELELTARCRDIQLTYVKTEMLTDTTGYLQLTEFTVNAVEQFRQGIETLQKEGMEQLIVDLRDNPGGLLDSVCDILDQILPGNLIVYTETKDGQRREYYAEEEGSLNCPLAVLVNEESASASEIFAGAVQDWGIGVIVGTPTYGKGVVQKTFPLGDGSAFKLTAEKYYTPGGQDIDGNGITPDYIVEEPGEQENQEKDRVLEKALEILGGVHPNTE